MGDKGLLLLTDTRPAPASRFANNGRVLPSPPQTRGLLDGRCNHKYSTSLLNTVNLTIAYKMKVILASIAAIALVAAKAGAATPNLRVSLLDSSTAVDEEDSAADYFDMLDILGFHSVVDDVSRELGIL